jgi:hypothetical protein
MIFHVKKDYLIAGNGVDVLTHLSFKYITGKYIDFSKRIGQWIRLERKYGHLYISDQYPIVGEFYRVNKTKYYCESFINNEALLSHSERPLQVIRHVGEIELA